MAGQDIYANQGYVELTPTLNTLSFQELATFVSVFEKKAFLITCVDYFLGITSVQEFDTESDLCEFGLSRSDKFAAANLGETSVFDYNSLAMVAAGAGVSSHLFKQPIRKDFSTFPGGGIIIPSRPIFLWMASAGWAAAGSIAARIYFLVKDLKAEEYWELVEATRLIGT